MDEKPVCSGRSCRRAAHLDHLAERPRRPLRVRAADVAAAVLDDRRPAVSAPRRTRRDARGTLVNRLVFSMGCHSGLSVRDAVGHGQHLRLAAGVRAKRRRRLPRQHGLRLRRQPRRRVLGAARHHLRQEDRRRLDRRQRARRRQAGVLRRPRRLRRLRREGDGRVHALRPADVVGHAPGGGLAPSAFEPRLPATSGGAQLLSVQAAAVAPTSTSVVTDSATGLQAGGVRARQHREHVCRRPAARALLDRA